MAVYKMLHKHWHTESQTDSTQLTSSAPDRVQTHSDPINGKPPLGRVCALKTSNPLRIGWLKSPHQSALLPVGPASHTAGIEQIALINAIWYRDWPDYTPSAQSWPQALPDRKSIHSANNV